MIFSFFLLGCPSPGADTSQVNTCPGLDCADALTLTVLDPDGAAAVQFSGHVTRTDGTLLSFSCGDAPVTDDGAVCLGSGQVQLMVYGEVLDVYIDQGDDAPFFSGTITPAWDAPYDSEECGHYCYIAEESVSLVPCDDCG